MELTSLIVYGKKYDREFEQIAIISNHKILEEKCWFFFKRNVICDYVTEEDYEKALQIAVENYNKYYLTYYEEIFITERWKVYDDRVARIYIEEIIWKDSKFLNKKKFLWYSHERE